MTFARDALPAQRQAASRRARAPRGPVGPSLLVQHLGSTVGNRSLARLIAARELARRPPKSRDPTVRDLDEWAKWPRRAHEHWKRLGALERIAVYERMKRRYGKDFAERFRKYAEAGKPDYDSRDCEMPVCTPEQYLKQGYKIAERAEYQIELVHPSGRSRYLFGGHPTTKPVEEDVEPPPEEPPIEEPPEVMDPAPPDLLQTDEPPIDFSGRSGVQRTARRGAAPKLALMRDPTDVSLSRTDPPYSWHARFSAELTGASLTLTIRAKIEPDHDVTDDEVEAVKKQTEPEFKRVWDSKFVVSEDGGKTERPVRVKLEFVERKQHLSIQLHRGSREDNRRNWFVSSPAIHRAHELGHQFGLLDEKIDPNSEDRKDAKSPLVFQDNSVMGDYMKEGIGKATVKLRHAQSIMADVGKALGKTFTVRMNVKP